jgi:hypothetical protein
MRSYSGLLVFETVLDSVPAADTFLVDFARSVFSPTVDVVEEDCGTLLGRKITVDYPVEGRMELATGERLTQARIEQLLSDEQYQIHIRTLDSCISEGGVCRKCLQASRPYQTAPEVGHSLAISPDYILFSEVIAVADNSNTTYTSADPSTYDRVLVYKDGVLLTSGYTLTPTSTGVGVFTLDTTASDPAKYTLHYVSTLRAPYMYWLAGTYAGSLLGMIPLDSPPLHLRPALVASLLSEGMTDSVLSKLTSLDRAPADLLEYATSIPSALEKALFALALGVIYSEN